MPTFAHSELINSLSRLFNKTVTIQANTPIQNGTGEPIASWGNLAGHVNIPCRVAPVAVPLAKREVARQEYTYSTQRTACVLQGGYPDITPRHRASIDGTIYNITTVEHDSESIYTRLLLEKIS